MPYSVARRGAPPSGHWRIVTEKGVNALAHQGRWPHMTLAGDLVVHSPCARRRRGWQPVASPSREVEDDEDGRLQKLMEQLRARSRSLSLHNASGDTLCILLACLPILRTAPSVASGTLGDTPPDKWGVEC
ncbi:hypothetical protein CHU98_g11017 [Xylaria longipes]|nr:hypothetical protein CHU98_g11017 [Xylaria longipes]